MPEAPDGRSERPARPAVALTIAGSDSGGGAGIQADLKTFQAFGVFGTSALTAVTAQNTRGVRDVQELRPDLVRAQIDAVVEDLNPAACKTGMLASVPIVRAVAAALDHHRIPDVVLDPVMMAQSGDPLLEPEAVDAVREELIPLATLLTPNLHEAGLLLGRPVEDRTRMEDGARELAELGSHAVLLKGGHLAGDEVVDVLLHDGEIRTWRRPRIDTRNTHGTGCTLSSAVAAGLALGHPLPDAVETALAYTREAIRTAPDLGAGSGPLNHLAPVPT